MLQMRIDKDVVLEFIKNRDYKYIRALGAFYWRLTTGNKDTYKVLEPLYSDFRKVVLRELSGQFTVVHMDEYVDMLLHEARIMDL